VYVHSEYAFHLFSPLYAVWRAPPGFDILLLGLFGPFILKRLGVLACFPQGVCAPRLSSAFFLLVFVCIVFGKRDFRSKVERTTYALGWRAHTVATEARLPLAYTVRAANVNDKVPAPKLLENAVKQLKRAGSAIGTLIADAQYYWEEFFNMLKELNIKPVIPAPPQIKKPLIHLKVRNGFIVEGDQELVKLYHMRMMVEQVFKPGKKRLNLDNLRWRGAAKVRMHIALCYSVILAIAITAHKTGKPELAHSIKAFQ
jgi:hypothetical protein